MRFFLVVFMIAFLRSLPGHDVDRDQPYVSFAKQDITSLSTDDIAELESGRGWGLALPA